MQFGHNVFTNADTEAGKRNKMVNSRNLYYRIPVGDGEATFD
jgi:hypothetical protein